MMRCPSDIELQSFFDGEISWKRVYQIEKHIGNCPVCQQKVMEFTEVVSLLKKGLSDVTVPRPASYRTAPISSKRWAWVAAVIIIIGTISGSLFYQAKQRAEWSPETEIMEQYVILYNEASSVVPE